MGSKKRLGQARRSWEAAIAPVDRAVATVEAFAAGVRLAPQLYASPAATAARKVVDLWHANHQIIYTVDADLQAEVVKTGMPDGAIPAGVFTRLPHPAPLFVLAEPVAVDGPDGADVLLYDSFIVAGTRDRVIDFATGDVLDEPQPLLRFVWFGRVRGRDDESMFSTSSIHLGGDVDLHKALAAIVADVPARAGEVAEVSRRIRGGNWGALNAQLFPLAAMLVVYACSQTPDLHAAAPPPSLGRRARRGYRLYEVGFRVGAAIRASRRGAGGARGAESSRTVTPHVRKAHWHRYWVGPRDRPDERQLVVRWIPPVGVNLTKGTPGRSIRPLRDPPT